MRFISAINLGSIEVKPTSDLEQVRIIINKLIEESPDIPKFPTEWCFVDCKLLMQNIKNCVTINNSRAACTAERFFRIDKAQENLHYLSDIAYDNLYILECGGGTVPQTPEDETVAPSPSSTYQTPYIIPEMRVR